MIEKETAEQLVCAALKVREKAYVPYSRYAVGAALLTAEKRIYTGCNIENASYGATVCAERTAVFKAVSEGERNFLAIAVSGGPEGEKPADYAYPCGVCRQVLNEFAAEDFTVIVARDREDFVEYSLKELLPCGFGGKSIR